MAAVLLAAMGLFGVVAGSVTQRRRELAVRLALGAKPASVVRLVVGEGARLALIGVLLAVPGVYFAGDILRGLLVGISPFDMPTLLTAAAGLSIVALIACYLPARRWGSSRRSRCGRSKDRGRGHEFRPSTRRLTQLRGYDQVT